MAFGIGKYVDPMDSGGSDESLKGYKDPWADQLSGGAGDAELKGYKDPLGPPPEPEGPISSLVKGIGRGLYYGNIKMAADTMDFLGKQLNVWNDNELINDLQKYGEKGLDTGTPKSIWAEAGEGIGLIGPAMILGGVGAGTVKALPVASKVMSAMAKYGLPAMFGAQRGEETMKAAAQSGEEPGVVPLATAAVTTLAFTLGGKAMERLFGPLGNIGKKAFGGLTAEGALKGSVVNQLKKLALETMPSAVGLVSGQAAINAEIERRSGIRPEADPWKEAWDTAGPIALMTAIMGPAGIYAHRWVAAHQAEILATAPHPQDADVNTTRAARYNIAQSVAEVMPKNKDGSQTELEKAWRNYAAEAIKNDLPIDVTRPLDVVSLGINTGEMQVPDDLKEAAGIQLKTAPVTAPETMFGFRRTTEPYQAVPEPGIWEQGFRGQGIGQKMEAVPPKEEAKGEFQQPTQDVWKEEEKARTEEDMPSTIAAEQIPKGKQPDKPNIGPQPIPTGFTSAVQPNWMRPAGWRGAIDWQNHCIVFETPEDQADPNVHNHEVAHILLEDKIGAIDKLEDSPFLSAYTKLSGDPADLHINFIREHLAIDYGLFLDNPDNVAPALKSLFDKYMREDFTPPIADTIPEKLAPETPISPEVFNDVMTALTGKKPGQFRLGKTEAKELFNKVTIEHLDAVTAEQILPLILKEMAAKPKGSEQPLEIGQRVKDSRGNVGIVADVKFKNGKPMFGVRWEGIRTKGKLPENITADKLEVVPEGAIVPSRKLKTQKEETSKIQSAAGYIEKTGIDLSQDYNLRELKQESSFVARLHKAGADLPDVWAQRLIDEGWVGPDFTGDELVKMIKNGSIRELYPPEKRDAMIEQSQQEALYEHLKGQAADAGIDLNTGEAIQATGDIKDEFEQEIRGLGLDAASEEANLGILNEFFDELKAQQEKVKTPKGAFENAEIEGAEFHKTFNLANPEGEFEKSVGENLSPNEEMFPKGHSDDDIRFMRKRILPAQMEEGYAKEQADIYGVRFDGMYGGYGGKKYPSFTDPVTDGSFIPQEGETVGEALERIRNSWQMAKKIRLQRESKAPRGTDVVYGEGFYDAKYKDMKIGKEPKNIIKKEDSPLGLKEITSKPDKNTDVINLFEGDKNIGGISKVTNPISGEERIGEIYLDPQYRGIGLAQYLYNKFPATPLGKAATDAAIQAKIKADTMQARWMRGPGYGANYGRQAEEFKPLVKDVVDNYMPGLDGHYEVLQTANEIPNIGLRVRVMAEADPRQVKAYYDPAEDKFYLIADHLKNPKEAIEAVLEEGFHKGIRTVFNKSEEMDNFLKRVYGFYGEDKIKAALEEHGYDFDWTKPEDQIAAAEEMLPKLQFDNPSLWQKFVDYVTNLVKDIGQKLGFEVRFDEDDIRRVMNKIDANLGKPAEARLMVGRDDVPLQLRIADYPNELKKMLLGAKDIIRNPELTPEAKGIVAELDKQVKAFDEKAYSRWRTVGSRPFWDALAHPKTWGPAWKIFGEQRPENRSRVNHELFRLQQHYMNLKDPEAFKRVNLALVAADAYREKIPGLTDAEREEMSKINRIPDSALKRGLRLYGETVQMDDAQLQAYATQREALDYMFEKNLEHIEDQIVRDFKKSAWYNMLLAAHGIVDKEAYMRLGAQDLPMISQANAKDMRIKVGQVFKNLDKQIEGLTSDQLNRLTKTYQDTYALLETGIKGVKEVVKEQTGLEGEDLTKFSQELVTAYLRTRPHMKAISDARKNFRENPFYMPRVRSKGDWAVQLWKDDENPETGAITSNKVWEDFHPGGQAAKLINRIYNEKDIHGMPEYTENGKLKEGYRIVQDKQKRTPEWAYEHTNDVNTFTIVNNAIDRIRLEGAAPEEVDRLKDQLVQTIGEEILARGWGHGVARLGTLVKGYETNDLVNVFKGYTSGLSGKMTKQIAARDFIEHMQWVKKNYNDPLLYESLAKYGRDNLRNPSEADRAVNWYRHLSFLWYLGGLIRAPLLHFSANYTWAMPELNSYIREQNKELKKAGFGAADLSGFSAYHKSMGDIARFVGTKTFLKGEQALVDIDFSKLPADGPITGDLRSAFLHDLMISGIGRAQFVDDIIRPTMANAPKAFKTFSDFMVRPFQSIITFNRLAAGDAMFRTAYKINEKRGMAPEKNLQESAREAISYVYRTQGAFHRANYSPLESGGGLPSAFIRGALTFRSFMHQYVLWMQRAIGKKDFRAVGESLAWTIGWGGLMAFPFAKDILDVITKHMGYNPTEAIRKKLKEYGGDTMEQVGMTGLPSLMGFKALSHPAIGIPFVGENPFQSITGSGGSLVQGEGRAWQAMLRGDWAGAAGYGAPQFVSAPFTALRQSELGKDVFGMQGFATTPHGKPIFGPDGRPMQYTAGETAAKMIGLYPTRPTEEAARHHEVTEIETHFVQKRQEIADAYRVAKNSGKKDAMSTLMKDIKEFNEDLKQKGADTLIPKLNLSSVLKSSTLTPTSKQKKEQKYLEGNFISEAKGG